MPRKKLFRSAEFPYHLTARANNREKFPGDLEFVWSTLSSELYLQFLCHQIRIHAFVLMPNHFHLMLTSPEREVDLVMREVLGSATRILNAKCHRSGHIFGGRYHWSLIREPDYFAHALKYVYRNPAKAALCEFVADYRFSTYAARLGFCHLPFPLHAPRRNLDRLLPDGIEAMDAWLNQAHNGEQQEAIRKGLRRKEFMFPVSRSGRRKQVFPI